MLTHAGPRCCCRGEEGEEGERESRPATRPASGRQPGVQRGRRRTGQKYTGENARPLLPLATTETATDGRRLQLNSLSLSPASFARRLLRGGAFSCSSFLPSFLPCLLSPRAKAGEGTGGEGGGGRAFAPAAVAGCGGDYV